MILIGQIVHGVKTTLFTVFLLLIIIIIIVIITIVIIFTGCTTLSFRHLPNSFAYHCSIAFLTANLKSTDSAQSLN